MQHPREAKATLRRNISVANGNIAHLLAVQVHTSHPYTQRSWSSQEQNSARSSNTRLSPNLTRQVHVWQHWPDRYFPLNRVRLRQIFDQSSNFLKRRIPWHRASGMYRSKTRKANVLHIMIVCFFRDQPLRRPVRKTLIQGPEVMNPLVVLQTIGDEPIGDEPMGDEAIGNEPIGNKPIGNEPIGIRDEPIEDQSDWNA